MSDQQPQWQGQPAQPWQPPPRRQTWWSNRWKRAGFFLALLVLFNIGRVVYDHAVPPHIAGADLAADVKRVLEQNQGHPDSVSCEDAPRVERAAIVDCTATSEGETAGLRVTFDDREGHFTVTAQAR